MPASPPSRLSYRPALDGVRAIAVLAVLVFHFGAGRLCPDGLGVGGRAARYDGVHFTAAGAADLWPWLGRQLRLAVAHARQ